MSKGKWKKTIEKEKQIKALDEHKEIVSLGVVRAKEGYSLVMLKTRGDVVIERAISEPDIKQIVLGKLRSESLRQFWEF